VVDGGGAGLTTHPWKRRVGSAEAARYPVGMEAVFITLMSLVIVLTGYVALVVLYKLYKADR
jgi:hypothetical protein